MLNVATGKENISIQPSEGLSFIANDAKREAMTTQESLKPAFPEIDKLETRYGTVQVGSGKGILFPVGLLGMPEKHHFILTEFPNGKLKQFKLLQSMDDANLSFVTLPLALDNDIIARDDIEHACRDMEIPIKDVAVVLIASIHRTVEGVTLSVNARAPVFIDATRRAGAQYVFTSSKYQVQHFLSH